MTQPLGPPMSLPAGHEMARAVSELREEIAWHESSYTYPSGRKRASDWRSLQAIKDIHAEIAIIERQAAAAAGYRTD